jgi:hypothetical protein
MFVTCTHLQPSLMFTNETRAYPSETKFQVNLHFLNLFKIWVTFCFYVFCSVITKSVSRETCNHFMLSSSGPTTFNLMTLSIMTHCDTQHNILTVMRCLSTISVLMLFATMPSNIMLSVTMLTFIMLVEFLYAEFSLCWVSLCWVSLCWVSLCWLSLCWVSFCSLSVIMLNFIMLSVILLA